MLLPRFWQKGINMNNNIKDKEKKAVVEIHKLLKECLVFDNIEDREFICKNLNLIKDYKRDIPEEMYSAVEDFVNEIIKPIIFDTNYFDFMIHEDFGNYNKEGHFVINSERSLEMMIFLLYERTLELDEKLSEFASKHLYLNVKY